MAEVILWVVLVLAGLIAIGFAARALMDNPRNDPFYGIVDAFTRLYLRLVHKPRVEGLSQVPSFGERPVVFVCNHTAGLDPVLVQIYSKHDIRWMMALDMRAPAFEGFWNWVNIIDVDREGGDAKAAREALRHLAQGGSVGIFPEGGLERPRRQLRPFAAGVGLIIKKSGALVIPVLIRDTPQVDPAPASLWHTSRSRVNFYEPIDYAKTDMGAKEITQDLFERFQEWTGWPVNEGNGSAQPIPHPGRAQLGEAPNDAPDETPPHAIAANA